VVGIYSKKYVGVWSQLLIDAFFFHFPEDLRLLLGILEKTREVTRASASTRVPSRPCFPHLVLAAFLSTVKGARLVNGAVTDPSYR